MTPKTDAPAQVVAEPSTAETEPPLDRINRRALDREVLEDPAVVARVRREAAAIRDALFPASFLEAAGLGKDISMIGGRLHLLQFREAAGASTDPIETLLLDMLALARVRVARVHALAETTTSPELIKTYLATGCRLMSEINKTVLTLAAYRDQARGVSSGGTVPHTELGSNDGGESSG